MNLKLPLTAALPPHPPANRLKPPLPTQTKKKRRTVKSLLSKSAYTKSRHSIDSSSIISKN